MSIVSMISFGILIVLLLSCLRRGADLFSPARVFGIVWSLAVGLTDLKLSRLQHAWDGYAWTALLVGLASFCLGVFAVGMLTVQWRLEPIARMRAESRSELISGRRLFGMILVLFVLYAVAYMIEWMHAGVLPAFAPFPEKARGEIGIFGLHLLVNSTPAILFLIVQYIIIVRGRGGSKILLFLLFVVMFGSAFFLLNRLSYFFFALLAIVFAYYATDLLKLRRAALVLPVFGLVFYYIQSLREIRYVKNYLYVVSSMKYSETYAWLTGPYMYVVMNLENFARGVSQLTRHSYGLFSFDFFFAIVGLKHLLAEYFDLQERVFLNSGFNTYPFLWDFYLDFGLAGLIVLPFVFGFVFALLHRLMRRAPSYRAMTYYALACFVVIISFFTNIVALLTFVVNAIVLIISQEMIRPGLVARQPIRQL